MKYRKMVTYFNRKDLVEFGKYLLSDERIKRFESAEKEFENLPPIQERLRSVHHADVENWLHEKNTK